MSQGLERRINAYVGEGVRIARRLRRLTISAAAEHAGMTPPRLREIEDGSSEASSRDLLLLSRALGVDMNFFFDGLTGEEPAAVDDYVEMLTETEAREQLAAPRLLN